MLAEKWAKNNNIPFPPINAEETFKKEGMKEFDVFKHPTDPTCPIVIHIVLVNDKFRYYKKPGKRLMLTFELGVYCYMCALACLFKV